MKIKKIDSRIRRKKKIKNNILKQGKLSLYVHRTSKHIYAQIIDIEKNITLVSASTIEKKISKKLKYTGNIKSANLIGEKISKRAIKKNISSVAFNRGGFLYHGRIKALANSARKYGLNF